MGQRHSCRPREKLRPPEFESGFQAIHGTLPEELGGSRMPHAYHSSSNSSSSSSSSSSGQAQNVSSSSSWEAKEKSKASSGSQMRRQKERNLLRSETSGVSRTDGAVSDHSASGFQKPVTRCAHLDRSQTSVSTEGAELFRRDLPRKMRRLQRRLRKLVKEHENAMTVGLSAVHLPSHISIGIRSNQIFPLASIVKLPLLVAALKQAEEEEKLGVKPPFDSWRLVMEEKDKCIGSGQLHKLPGGISIPYRDCLLLMHAISDNTAADMVLNAVTLPRLRRFIASCGLSDTNIHLSQRQAFLIALGQAPHLKGLPPKRLAAEWCQLSTAQRMQVAAATEQQNRHLSVAQIKAMEIVSEQNQKKAGPRGFLHDMAVAEAVDNYGSPADTTCLLLQLAKNQLLSPEWMQRCFQILRCQQYGRRRLPLFMPPHVDVYHKTGTILGIVNAAGIIKQQGVEECLAISVFIKNVQRCHEKEAELVIARVTKLVFNACFGCTSNACLQQDDTWKRRHASPKVCNFATPKSLTFST